MNTAKDIRTAAPSLFVNHMGGPLRRMVYGAPVTGPNGIYFVTSERAGFGGRKFHVRRLEQSGSDPAPVTHTFTFGHLAINKARELAS